MDGSIKREAYYDRNLDIEAYRLFGVFQSFPAHFHNYYVVGIVENGERKMFVKNKEYNVKKGDLIMFNP